MPEKVTYWPNSATPLNSVAMEFRSLLAWQLLERVGICTGVSSREDSAGRAVLDIMPAPELVARAFEIADAFVDASEARGEIRPVTEADVESRARRGGDLERIQNDATYPKGRFADVADAFGASSEKPC